MGKFVLLSLCLVDVLVCLGAAQQPASARVGPWRQHIQWENNGRRYSLLSTGTQYRPLAQTRRRTQLLLTTKSTLSRASAPLALSRPISARPGDADVGHSRGNDLGQINVSVLGSDASHYLISLGRPGASSQPPPRITGEPAASRHRPHQAPSNGSAFTIQEFSGSGVPRGGRSAHGGDAGAQQAVASPVTSPSSDSTVRSPATSEWNVMSEESGNATRHALRPRPGEARGARPAHALTRAGPVSDVSPTGLSSNAVDVRVSHPRTTGASNPRDPHSIHHRNSVFYNVYPADRRNRISAGVPGPGYGTRFFHNGETA